MTRQHPPVALVALVCALLLGVLVTAIALLGPRLPGAGSPGGIEVDIDRHTASPRMTVRPLPPRATPRRRTTSR